MNLRGALRSGRGCVERRVVQAGAVAPGSFGAVERAVGALQPCVERIAGQQRGHAEARGEGLRAGVEKNRALTDAAGEALSGEETIRHGGCRHQDHEFLAPHAGHEIALAAIGLQEGREVT